MNKVVFSAKVPLLMKATSDSPNPTPGHLFAEINKITFESLEYSIFTADYLTERLTKKSLHVKIKVLQVIRNILKEGSGEFAEYLRKHDEHIRHVQDINGPPDPLHGDTYYVNIRNTAKEVITLLFNLDRDAPKQSTKISTFHPTTQCEGQQVNKPTMFAAIMGKVKEVVPNLLPPPVQTKRSSSDFQQFPSSAARQTTIQHSSTTNTTNFPADFSTNFPSLFPSSSTQKQFSIQSSLASNTSDFEIIDGSLKQMVDDIFPQTKQNSNGFANFESGFGSNTAKDQIDTKKKMECEDLFKGLTVQEKVMKPTNVTNSELLDFSFDPFSTATNKSLSSTEQAYDFNDFTFVQPTNPDSRQNNFSNNVSIGQSSQAEDNTKILNKSTNDANFDPFSQLESRLNNFASPENKLQFDAFQSSLPIPQNYRLDMFTLQNFQTSPQNSQQLLSPQNSQQLSPQNSQQLLSLQNSQQLLSPQNSQTLLSPQNSQPLLSPQNSQPSSPQNLISQPTGTSAMLSPQSSSNQPNLTPQKLKNLHSNKDFGQNNSKINAAQPTYQQNLFTGQFSSEPNSPSYSNNNNLLTSPPKYHPQQMPQPSQFSSQQQPNSQQTNAMQQSPLKFQNNSPHIQQQFKPMQQFVTPQKSQQQQYLSPQLNQQQQQKYISPQSVQQQPNQQYFSPQSIQQQSNQQYFSPQQSSMVSRRGKTAQQKDMFDFVQDAMKSSKKL